MSSFDKNNCSQCQNKKTIKFNNSKKRQPTASFTANNFDYNIPSTSTAQYDRPSSPEDVSCVNIRNMVFLKNLYKNVPELSKQFLEGVDCAVIKILQEIEENHKCCVKKKSNKQTLKRPPKS
ncbi:uncharacterized protein LOC132948878 [Metopolophium dirhodum]|uniref:uncharacterized protein LOC132948878 n=1 Tax=Metopolophium dirhodum TaxID=44670 RepID=UPI0029902385|nr:uncharacterized protein LOC132948878 [Metopolophium dirhodum]